MQEWVQRPRSQWQRLGPWLGLTFEEDTLLDGLARRLAFATVGAGVVMAVGSVAPAWVGLTVLTVWFLPLLYHAALGQCVVLLSVLLVGLAGFRALPPFIGLVVAQAFEEGVLVLTVASLVGWLL
jgi:hypothetical protein